MNVHSAFRLPQPGLLWCDQHANLYLRSQFPTRCPPAGSPAASVPSAPGGNRVTSPMSGSCTTTGAPPSKVRSCSAAFTFITRAFDPSNAKITLIASDLRPIFASSVIATRALPVESIGSFSRPIACENA